MENSPIIVIPPPTKEQYVTELRRMYSEGYKTFRKDSLRNALLAYFYFLEREITGKPETAYGNNAFTIEELENMIEEMVVLYDETNKQKRRTAEILT